VSNTISVIVPTYQHAQTITACLDSILAQTRRVDEMIVVNDGSTDDTARLLMPYADRVSIIHQTNQGGNVARNKGFAAASGSMVMFCDADAILRADMIERLEHALEADPTSSYAYSGFRFGWKPFRSFPFDAERLRRMNYIHTTALIRRRDFPGFDPSIKRFQDWDVWLTMLEQGKRGVFVDAELFRIEDARGRVGISQWRPSWMYKIPWKKIGWLPPSVRRYEQARDIIVSKHHLA